MGHPARANLRVVACLVSLLVGSCTSGEESIPASSMTTAVPTTDVGGLLEVSLPDVTTMAEPVRERIQEQFSALLSKAEDPATTSVELSNAYGETGNLLMSIQHFDAAESSYLNAQTLRPSDMRWPYFLGHVYRAKGETEQAATFFEQALTLNPDDLATLLWLGEVYLVLDRPSAAKPPLAKARSIQTRSVDALFGLGRVALAQEDHAQAVKYLKEALAIDTQALKVHYPLALAYRGLGDLAKAEQHLALRPTGRSRASAAPIPELQQLLQSPRTYEVRGAEALDSGDWTEAASLFRQGVELAPADPSLRHRLGTALHLLGETREAMEQFEEALRIAPDYAQSHYSVGLLLEAGGRTEEARERFSAAVRYEPSYIEARLRLAGILRRTGSVQEALHEYEQVMKLDPRIAEGRFGYAMSLVRVSRDQEAHTRLIELTQDFPEQPAFALALARLFAASPDTQVRDGQLALEILDGLPDEQRTLDFGETVAMALAELGRYEEAANWQRRGIEATERAGRGDLAQSMAESLGLYERREPNRTPWRNDEILFMFAALFPDGAVS